MLVRKHIVTKATPVRLTVNPEMNSYFTKFFDLLKNVFSKNFKTNINIALFEYRCLHMANWSTTEKFACSISNERKFSQETKLIQMERHFQWQISHNQGGMTGYCPTHQWQSSKDSKKSLIKSWKARGRSLPESLRALNMNSSKGLRMTKQTFSGSITYYYGQSQIPTKSLS